MSTQAAAVPDSYPVQWTGRLAIVIVPQHVGEFMPARSAKNCRGSSTVAPPGWS